MIDRRRLPLALALLVLAGLIALGWRLRRKIFEAESNTPPAAEIARAKSELRRSGEAAALTARHIHPAVGRTGTAAAQGAQRFREKTDHLNALLQDPAFRDLLRRQMSLLALPKFAPFLRSLRLPPAEAHDFINLIVDKMLAKTEGLALGTINGIAVPTLSPEYLKVVNDAEADANQRLAGLLGDSGYAAYQHYEETYSLRNTLTEVKLLSGGSPPISEDQSQKLIEAWYAALPAKFQGNTTGSGINFLQSMDPSDFTVPLPPNAVELARTILSHDQMPGVERLVDMLQAERRLMMAPR